MKCHHCGGSGEEPDQEPVLGTALEVQNGNGKLAKPRSFVELKEHLSTVLHEVASGHRERLKIGQMRTLKARLVFAFWQAQLGHEKSLADDQRIGRLRRCLEQNGDNVHELLYAIEGWLKDPIFKKFADEGRVLDDIENIFRSRAVIERLAGHKRGYRESTPHPMARKYLEGVST